MEVLQVVAPLVGVVLGAGLSGVAWYWRERSKRKRVVALALSDLLEVRHHVASVELMLNALKTRMGIDPSEASIARELIEYVSPIQDKVHKRYDDAVTLLAGIDPILAFGLRSKNTLPDLLSQMRTLGSVGGTALPDIEEIQSTFVNVALPRLNEAARRLANAHSRRTSRDVEQLISGNSVLPPDLEKLLDVLKAVHIAGKRGSADA